MWKKDAILQLIRLIYFIENNDDAINIVYDCLDKVYNSILPSEAMFHMFKIRDIMYDYISTDGYAYFFLTIIFGNID